MARPGPNYRWVREIRQIAAANEGWGAGRIAAELAARAHEDKSGLPPESECPPQRTVGRILKEFRGSDFDRRPYLEVYWPQTFEQMSTLPWEASRPVLELLAHLAPKRPTVRQAQWYWRVYLAGPPDMGVMQRLGHAFTLADAEGSETPESTETVEAVLMGLLPEQPKPYQGERGNAAPAWLLEDESTEGGK